MRARDILLEAYDRKKTLYGYADRIKARYETELTNDPLGPDGYHASIGDVSSVLNTLERADPTPKKAFVLDLLRWYLDGSMRFLEDAHKATPALTLYGKFRNRGLPPLKSLSFPQLLDLGDELDATHSKSEAGRAEEQGFYDREEAFLMRDTEHYKVIMPYTEEAAKFFGRGTRWCTASENNNMFARYYQRGRLYIVLFKGRPKKWQLHCEAEQFMDASDEQITTESWFAETDFVGWFVPEIMKAQLPNHGRYLLQYYPNPDSLPDTEKLHQIGRNPWNFRLFEKPDRAMCIKMVWCGKADTVRAIVNLMPRHESRVDAEKVAIEEFGPEFYFTLGDVMSDTKDWYQAYLRSWLMNSVTMNDYDDLVNQWPEVCRFAIVNDLLSGEYEKQMVRAAKQHLPNAHSALYARDNKRKKVA